MERTIRLHLCTQGHAQIRFKNTDFNVDKGTFFYETHRMGVEVLSSEDYSEELIKLSKDDFLYIWHKVGIELFTIYSRNYFITKLTTDQEVFFMGIAQQLKKISGETTKSQSKETYFNKLEKEIYHNLITISGIKWLLQDHKEDQAQQSSNDVISFLRTIFTSEKAIINVDSFLEGKDIQKRHLNELLKKATGQSIKQWLNIVSIDNCKYCLRYTSLSLKEAADFLGFPDANTFEKYFKRHTGCTPTDFRTKFTSEQNEA